MFDGDSGELTLNHATALLIALLRICSFCLFASSFFSSALAFLASFALWTKVEGAFRASAFCLSALISSSIAIGGSKEGNASEGERASRFAQATAETVVRPDLTPSCSDPPRAALPLGFPSRLLN